MKITDMERCVGCGACASVCPVSAISMSQREDKLGFLYPLVDTERCISCGKCVRACTANREAKCETPAEYAIARTHSTLDARVCTSGGVATALADYFVRDLNGVAYGAVYDNGMVRHLRAASEEDVDRLRGSKYVQSEIHALYDSIDKDLKAGLSVLFVGTPCQCASMYMFVNNPRFFMLDLVCNGVGSPMVFADHVLELEARYRGKIENYLFRCKDAGYLDPDEKLMLADGRSLKLSVAWEKWGSLYYNGLVTRECCMTCPYATRARVGDLTLSDLPTALRREPGGEQDRYGATYLSVNTQKGRELSDILKKICTVSPAEEVLEGRRSIAPVRPAALDLFATAYASGTLNRAKLAALGRKTQLKSAVKKILLKLKYKS